MTSVLYDATYEGWLTAVFDVYDHKLGDVIFAKNEASSNSLFGTTHRVVTDETKVKRVLNGLQKRLSGEGLDRLSKTYLSEIDRVEDTMLRFVRHVFDNSQSVEEDYSNPAVWAIRNAAKRVKREAHRMEAFVRFQLTKDQLYYAVIEPECDVLPLIAPHFESRYADQRWLIYDTRRRYGLYYDLKTVNPVAVAFNQSRASSLPIVEFSDEDEEFYQALWCHYLTSVTIEGRTNRRLQLQHMPKRYWRYLTEKRPRT